MILNHSILLILILTTILYRPVVTPTTTTEEKLFKLIQETKESNTKKPLKLSVLSSKWNLRTSSFIKYLTLREIDCVALELLIDDNMFTKRLISEEVETTDSAQTAQTSLIKFENLFQNEDYILKRILVKLDLWKILGQSEEELSEKDLKKLVLNEYKYLQIRLKQKKLQEDQRIRREQKKTSSTFPEPTEVDKIMLSTARKLSYGITICKYLLKNSYKKIIEQRQGQTNEPLSYAKQVAITKRRGELVIEKMVKSFYEELNREAFWMTWDYVEWNVFRYMAIIEIFLKDHSRIYGKDKVTGKLLLPHTSKVPREKKDIPKAKSEKFPKNPPPKKSKTHRVAKDNSVYFGSNTRSSGSFERSSELNSLSDLKPDLSKSTNPETTDKIFQPDSSSNIEDPEEEPDESKTEQASATITEEESKEEGELSRSNSFRKRMSALRGLFKNMIGTKGKDPPKDESAEKQSSSEQEPPKDSKKSKDPEEKK